jgi:hypothetical protein
MIAWDNAPGHSHNYHRKPGKGEINIPPLQGLINKLESLLVALPQAIILRPCGAVRDFSISF